MDEAVVGCFIWDTNKEEEIKFVSLGQVIGEWGGVKFIMKKKFDPDMPSGKVRIVKDFLPSPEELFSDQKIRVTVYLSKNSVHYFKIQAKKYHTKYQRVIRTLLDHYVSSHAA